MEDYSPLSPDGVDQKTAQSSVQPPALTSEDVKNARKALNRAKRDAKNARRAAAKAAEKAAEEAAREAARKRREELKVTVVDGNVVDQEGRVIRPYTRVEWFLDNKPLVYSLLLGFIALCLVLAFYVLPE
jgi:hypothetical protein